MLATCNYLLLFSWLSYFSERANAFFRDSFTQANPHAMNKSQHRLLAIHLPICRARNVKIATLSSPCLSNPCNKASFCLLTFSWRHLHSTTGARFSRAKAPSDCERFLSFTRLVVSTSSCSDIDCLRASASPATGENWRSMFSSDVSVVPQALQFCWCSWFWDPAKDVLSSSEFLRFLLR